MRDSIDVPLERIDWGALLSAAASADSFSAMLGPVYASGVLVSDYDPSYGDDFDEAVETADVATLRSLLTSIVRGDRFVEGSGEEAYWDGDIDLVFDALAANVGETYPLPPNDYLVPRRVPACPACGDTGGVQYIIHGMPPGPPEGFDENRVVFAGCVVDGEVHSWHCPSCDADYDPPYVDAWRDSWSFETVSGDAADGLTAAETGQLARDITLGRPTEIVLDTETKRQTFLTLQDQIREIADAGGIVETPE